METQEFFKLGIGTKETSKLKPAKVRIASVLVKTKTNDGREMKSPLAEIMCKHPDRDELVAMTKVKLERNGKLEIVSTWVNIEEEDGVKKIQKSSALAHLMTFMKVTSLEDLYGKDIEAVEQSKEDTYLCLKAY